MRSRTKARASGPGEKGKSKMRRQGADHAGFSRQVKGLGFYFKLVRGHQKIYT